MTAHLSPQTAELLTLSDHARIQRIRSPRWIGYPQAKEILAKLEDLLTYPKSHRMPNLLIVGDTNNGKTMLVERFHSLHPASDEPNGVAVSVPVLVVQAPPVPDEGRFYNAILELLFAPYKPADRVDKKQFQVLKLLKQVGLKMLIIDEVHHILAGNLNRQKGFLNVIKYLGNELEIPVVGVGTRDAYRAIQTDPQLSNRFEPAVLPRWELDELFLRLLMSFERMLPLKEASNLHETTLAIRLMSLSEGYIGELSQLLSAAAVHAIQSGREKIDGKVLDEIRWTSPPDPGKKDSLLEKLNLAIGLLENGNLMSKKELAGIKTELSDKNSLLSPVTLNAYVHSEWMNPDPLRLKITWNNAQLMIERIWHAAK